MNIDVEPVVILRKKTTIKSEEHHHPLMSHSYLDDRFRHCSAFACATVNSFPFFLRKTLSGKDPHDPHW